MARMNKSRTINGSPRKAAIDLRQEAVAARHANHLASGGVLTLAEFLTRDTRRAGLREENRASATSCGGIA